MRPVRTPLLFILLILTWKPVVLAQGVERRPLPFAQNAKDNKAVRDFIHAAEEGDLTAVKAFIARGMNIDAEPVGFKGWTALMAASTYGQAQVVKFLLASGADATVKLKDGSTTLYQAAQNGNREVAEALISSGVELNARTDKGRTALIRAAWMGHADVVKVLLAAGVDREIKDQEGWSAFKFAASSGDPETIKAFLASGADVNGRDEKGETPLIWATLNRKDETFKALLDAGGAVNARSKSGVSALMRAASYLDFRKVKALIVAGAEVNARDANGWTALMFAAFNSRYRGLWGHDNEFMHRLHVAGTMIEDLVAAGADVNTQAHNGETALVLAVNSGHGNIVRALLAHGADTLPVQKLKNRMVVIYNRKLPLRRITLAKLLQSVEH